MRDEAFETHEPVDLHVDNPRGVVRVIATDTTETTVTLDGPDEEDVEVGFDGRHLFVRAPKQTGFMARNHDLEVVVTLPRSSSLVARLGSADLDCDGALGRTEVRSGSGDVEIDTLEGASSIETGSGDVHTRHLLAPAKIKCGSGDVLLETVDGPTVVSTGSGDVQVRDALAPLVVKTGSGDLEVHHATGDVSLTSGSGDLALRRVEQGTIKVKGASSAVWVGIPSGTPVWTDVSTLTGRLHSGLDSTGAPEEGQPYVELHVTTVSGDVALQQV